MAGLIPLNTRCQACRHHDATVELIGEDHRSRGKFCATCGEDQHRILERVEQIRRDLATTVTRNANRKAM